MTPERYRLLCNGVGQDDLCRLLACAFDQETLQKLVAKLPQIPDSANGSARTKGDLVRLAAEAFHAEYAAASSIARALNKRHSNELSKLEQMHVPEVLDYLRHRASGEGGSTAFCKTLWAALLDEREAVLSAALETAALYQGGAKPGKDEEICGPCAEGEEEGEGEDENGLGDLPNLPTYMDPEEAVRGLLSHPEHLVEEFSNLYHAAVQRDRHLVKDRRREKKLQQKLDTALKNVKQLQDACNQANQNRNELKTLLHESQHQVETLEQRVKALEDWSETKESLLAQIAALHKENHRLRENLTARDGEHENFLEAQDQLVHKSEEYVALRTSYINTLENIIEERERFLYKLTRTREDVESSLFRIENERMLHLQRLRSQHTTADPAIGVFVDVQNMFYAARKRYNGKLNYQALLEYTLRKRRLAKAVAYIIQTPDVDQSSFIALLERCGFQVKSKELKTRLDGSAKGDWDMEIAMDIISSIHKLDIVVLVSGDGDFTPLVRMIKKHGITVEVSSFEYNTAMELREAADKFLPIDHTLILGM